MFEEWGMWLRARNRGEKIVRIDRETAKISSIFGTAIALIVLVEQVKYKYECSCSGEIGRTTNRNDTPTMPIMPNLTIKANKNAEDAVSRHSFHYGVDHRRKTHYRSS